MTKSNESKGEVDTMAKYLEQFLIDAIDSKECSKPWRKDEIKRFAIKRAERIINGS